VSLISLTDDLAQRDAPEFRGGAVHGPERRRRRIDRHGCGNLVHGDAVDKLHEIFQRINGHAALSAFAPGLGRIGVVAHKGRKIEGRTEARLTFLQQHVPAFVGGLGIAHAGKHPEDTRYPFQNPCP